MQKFCKVARKIFSPCKSFAKLPAKYLALAKVLQAHQKNILPFFNIEKPPIK